MHLRPGVLLTFRPRAVTVIVFLLAAMLITLANLSEDYGLRRPTTLAAGRGLVFDVQELGAWHPYQGTVWNLSYGWPLLWRQYVGMHTPGPTFAFGECYSASRLAANIAIWTALLALTAGVCECLLRRYRPPLRWSLRTMLLGVSVLASMLGWYVAARNRAATDDAIVEMLQGSGEVWFERWGPRWLDVIGVDRLCRRIIGAKVGFDTIDANWEARALEILRRLQKAPEMQYLFIESFYLTPKLASALGDFAHLRMLSIGDQQIGVEPGAGSALADALGRLRQLRVLMLEGFDDDEEPVTRPCLAAIGKLQQLECLYLGHADVDSESLASLAQLTNLKTLYLSSVHSGDRSLGQPMLSRLPVLPGLRELHLGYSYCGDDDLDYLTRLPKLKTLSLLSTDVTAAGLAKLAAFPSLEELTLDGDALSPAGLKKLLMLGRLRALHFNANYRLTAAGEPVPFVEECLREPCLDVLRMLRQARRGIVIDGDFWRDKPWVPDEYDTSDRLQSPLQSAREAARFWKEQGRPAAPLPVLPPAAK